MQNKRATPRSIHFRESIQIREIPRNESDGTPSFNEFEEEPSSDIYLTDQQLFQPKSHLLRNVLIGVVAGGIVLIAAIIGAVIATVSSQKTSTTTGNTLTYNALCTTGSNQCIASQGLSCSAGFCSCSSLYSWNTAATTCILVTYNQACTTSDQCNSFLGLNCTDNLCQCDGDSSWSSVNSICEIILNDSLSYRAACVMGSSQCDSSVGLTCTGNCTCQNSKVWNVSSCVCPAGTFLNSSNLCQPAFSLNYSCIDGSDQCDSTKDLICSSSICQCDYSTKFWDITLQKCSEQILLAVVSQH